MHGLRLNLQDFGIGKKLAFQKLVKPDPVMKLCARVFMANELSATDWGWKEENDL